MNREELKNEVCKLLHEQADVVTIAKVCDAIDQIDSPRWIPVSERLPEEYRLVIVCNPDSIRPTYGWYIGGSQWVINDEPEECFTKLDYVSFVTHWMPLPEAPVK